MIKALRLNFPKKWLWKIWDINSCHVKNEFELTTDLEALHSQMAKQLIFFLFKEGFIQESEKSTENLSSFK